MQIPTTLNELKVGQFAVVNSIKSTGSMRRRLLDIGLIDGTEVECVGTSSSGDPKAFLIRGAVIAIRSEDCKNIFVNIC
jgi:ferrous iron transport protein A